ncbi:hypothetical protein BS17DRAFT_584615 [Gyrodon lividus]|nr:hypothetical protein BS17DRAFT_584615 [Gyrodon lividus]
MDSRPYFLFQRLLEWLSSLTKRASSVVLRLFCALQAYWRHWSSTPNSRRTSVGSSRYFSANGVESQVINPSNVNVTPVLPIHTAHVQVAGSSRLRTGRSTYTTTQHGNPVPHIPHSGSVVNGELVAPDSNQVDVRVRMTSADGVKRYDRNIRL